MPTVWPKCSGITIRAREFSQQDLVLIRRMIRNHPGWGRTQLSERVCEAFEWRQPNGRLKDRACRVVLLKLESMGFLRLPKRLLERGGRPPRACDPLDDVPTITEMPPEISVDFVHSRRQSRIWNALIARYHYLGLSTPVGRLVRYLVYGNEQLLGAISFSECAWNVAPRNTLLRGLGMSESDIREHVLSNNRFLILPSVTVPNLASRVLALALRAVRSDWLHRYGYAPLAVETFVDPRRYRGTCYSAANWVLIGKTRGYSKSGASHLNRQAPKLIFLRGFGAKFHRKISRNRDELDRRAA